MGVSIKAVAITMTSLTIGFWWGFAVHLGVYGNQFRPVALILTSLTGLVLVLTFVEARRTTKAVA